MTPKIGSAEYQRQLRANNPEYAERSRQQSLAAKRRRRGSCERCGAETKYNGHTVNGPSKVCAACIAKENHEQRRWTRETIMRAFRRFQAETGRTPRALDAQGPQEAVVTRLSGRRIRELEQVRELGLVLPQPSAVYREFGSWEAALKAVGMPVSRGGTPDHRRLWP